MQQNKSNDRKQVYEATRKPNKMSPRSVYERPGRYPVCNTKMLYI